MKVKELIELLSKFDGDKDVWHEFDYDHYSITGVQEDLDGSVVVE